MDCHLCRIFGQELSSVATRIFGRIFGFCVITFLSYLRLILGKTYTRDEHKRKQPVAERALVASMTTGHRVLDRLMGYTFVGGVQKHRGFVRMIRDDQQVHITSEQNRSR